MATKFLPLRVVQPGEEIVDNEEEDTFGTQIVPYGYTFQMHNPNTREIEEQNSDNEDFIVQEIVDETSVILSALHDQVTFMLHRIVKGTRPILHDHGYSTNVTRRS
ncbi:uncharacterized protein LOC120071420 [Benincasa hispida]|uniref:uncharacterized protein LOC120071420 n=1 Tax=Benincasa hispida TaxID=102211 RepID=UPI00190084CE|nr:uncharacterized protein LOC120071420 [Benincasa hispida]